MADEPEAGALAEAEDTAAPVVQDDSAAEATQTVEEFATEMGWRPKADYTGPDGKWRPAGEWLKQEREISRSLKKKVDRISDQLDRQGEASSKAMQRALDRQAADLREKFAEAVENKDTKGAAEAANELASLVSDAPKDRDYAAEFSERNAWYGSNRKATALANMVSGELGERGIPKAKQLEMIEAEVRKEMPELFGDPAKKPHAAVASPSSARTTRGKTVADLPAEAKKAMESSIRALTERFGDKVKPDDERKAYARDYWQLQGEEAA